MRSRIALMLVVAAVTVVAGSYATLVAAGFGGGAMGHGGGIGGGFGSGARFGGGFGGAARFGGGGFAGESFGGGGFAGASGGQHFGVSGDFSHSSGGEVPRLTGESFGWSTPQAPVSGANVTGGRVPSFTRPAGDERSSIGNSGPQLPSGNRANIGSRNAPIGSGERATENFLGIAGGTAGAGVAGRTSLLSASRSGNAGQLGTGARAVLRPEERANWKDWSQNRDTQWQQRVDNQHEAWNSWQQTHQERLTDFRNAQEQQWNDLQSARSNRQDRVQYRQGLWSYRWDRADQIRSDARDSHNSYFDDRWWGQRAWVAGHGNAGFGHHPEDPWWWWTHGTWRRLSGFVRVIVLNPYYIDYGSDVIYDGDTVYVDDQPVPADQYSEPMVDLGATVEQPPPPTPPGEGLPEEWMPLGVFALAQEEKGDPIMYLQLSVNREGVISGAYSSTLTQDQRPIAGKVDKVTQQVAWRIGTTTNTIFVTGLANLTRDVSPVTIHFGPKSTQVWLLVRMPEPAPAGEPTAIPEIDRTLPPAKTVTSKSQD